MQISMATRGHHGKRLPRFCVLVGGVRLAKVSPRRKEGEKEGAFGKNFLLIRSHRRVFLNSSSLCPANLSPLRAREKSNNSFSNNNCGYFFLFNLAKSSRSFILLIGIGENWLTRSRFKDSQNIYIQTQEIAPWLFIFSQFIEAWRIKFRRF